MENKRLINTKDLLKEGSVTALNDYTVEEIKQTVEKYGDVSIPLSVLDIIAYVRDSKSGYGVLTTTKYLYTQIGVWGDVNQSAYKIVDRFVRKNGLIYLSVFDKLENKSFTNYVCCIDKILGSDMGVMADILAQTHNLPIEVAERVIGIVVYLNSYNGFIMEYMVSEMVSTHPTLYTIEDGVEFDGDLISPSILDKDWGIDLLIGVGEEREDGAIQIPLQIKSYTHLGKSRTALSHTFKAHSDYKKKYKGVLERESKGNVYYLHYRVADLSITVPKADFNYTLPQSRELAYRVFNTDTLDLRVVPIWEVCHILEEVAERIREDVWAE